jgi:hypothetical protein
MFHTRMQPLIAYLGDSIRVGSQVRTEIQHHWLEDVYEHLHT